MWVEEGTSCLWVFYSYQDVNPEIIYVDTIDLSVDFKDWEVSGELQKEVVIPNVSYPYEGEKVLDPFIFKDEYDQLWILYSANDENAIAAARLTVL